MGSRKYRRAAEHRFSDRDFHDAEVAMGVILHPSVHFVFEATPFGRALSHYLHNGLEAVLRGQDVAGRRMDRSSDIGTDIALENAMLALVGVLGDPVYPAAMTVHDFLGWWINPDEALLWLRLRFGDEPFQGDPASFQPVLPFYVLAGL
jgi:hypothetical protein